jgi:hypothetical protein
MGVWGKGFSVKCIAYILLQGEMLGADIVNTSRLKKIKERNKTMKGYYQELNEKDSMEKTKDIKYVFDKARAWANDNREDGDYKDEAGTLCRGIERWAFALGLDRVSPFKEMPDGFNCPRSFWKWYDKNAI